MAREIKVFEIDGHKIEIFQLPIKLASSNFGKLFKLFGKAIGDAVSNMDSAGGIGILIGGVAENIDDPFVQPLIESLIPYITVDQKKMTSFESFDEYGFSFYLKTIAKSLEVNFGGFLLELLEKGKERAEQTQKLTELIQQKT